MAQPARKRRPPKAAGSRRAAPASIWLRVHRRELATILAALRFHRDENVQGTAAIPDRRAREIATGGGTFQALDFEEITQLCRTVSRAARAPQPIYVRSWTCPACGRSIDRSYEDLAEAGIPICTACDRRMKL